MLLLSFLIFVSLACLLTVLLPSKKKKERKHDASCVLISAQEAADL